MQTLFFIDLTSGYTHLTIKNRGIGASEYQFYNLIFYLSKYFKIECFNHIKKDIIIDNIKYDSLHNNFVNCEISKDDIFIIQRFLPNLNDKIYEKIKNNKIFIWNHDLIHKSNFYWSFSEEEKKKCNDNLFFKNNVLNEYFNNKNINYIFVSKNVKNDFLNFTSGYGYNFEKNRIHYIYNILYEEEFRETTNLNIECNKFLLTYASALHKGIEKVVFIFDELLKIDNRFILQIMSPGYEWNNWGDYIEKLKNKYNNNIIIVGPVDKIKYGENIKKSLCVFSGTYCETFGCIFAESYYLGTPVICDTGSGAVKEIIDNDYVINYNEVNKIIEKILYINTNRETMKIFLDDKFMLNYNLRKWITKINGMNKSLYKSYDSQYLQEGGCWNKSTCLKEGIIETYSGPGSLLENTDLLVEKLSMFINKYEIKSIIDVPCGDFNYMSRVNLENVNYIGYDISKKAIDRCKKYKKNNINFYIFDATIEKLPNVDFILCKDLFLHLSFDDIKKILNNVLMSKCKYFGVSRYSLGNVNNRDQESGLSCRAIEITKEPFNFKYPIIEEIYNTSKHKTLTWMSDQIIIFKL